MSFSIIGFSSALLQKGMRMSYYSGLRRRYKSRIRAGLARTTEVMVFREWRPCLKPVVPELIERIRQAVFWRPVMKCEIVTPDIHPSDIGPLTEDIRLSLEDELMDRNFKVLFESVGQQGHELLLESLEEMLWNDLDKALQLELNDALPGSNAEPIRRCVTESLWASLYYPAGYTITGRQEMAVKFEPLKDLWLAGNFIIGCDEADTIHILAAKQT